MALGVKNEALSVKRGIWTLKARFAVLSIGLEVKIGVWTIKGRLWNLKMRVCP